jgi:hypothetical protein
MQAGLQELKKYLGSAKEKLGLDMIGPVIQGGFEVDYTNG